LALSFTVFQTINPETLIVRFKPMTTGELLTITDHSLQKGMGKEKFRQKFDCLVKGKASGEFENCDGNYHFALFTKEDTGSAN
jgi:hypothetical protein